LDRSKTFWDQQLSPASVVHFQGNGALTEEALEKASDYPIPEMDASIIEDDSEVVAEAIAPPETYQSSLEAPPPKSETKLPKWLRLK
jgi:type III secretion system FlhB-like substrate exporter